MKKKTTTKMTEGFHMIHDMVKLRWVPEIVASIHQGNHQFNDILRSINYLSNTELSRKLSVLVERNAVFKEASEDPFAGYFLTSFGEDLEHIFHHFEEMSEKYLVKKNA
ncbi:winged helix-turn-helix transcriptional regulator [Fusibacter sp. JL298sf-3]